MHVVRDLLDKELLDTNEQQMGRVDGLIMEIRPGEPPCITTISVGGTTLTRRLPGFVGRWLTAAVTRWGVRKGEPYTVPWSYVEQVGHTSVRLNVDSDQTPAMATAHWIRDHIIAHIPGA